GPPIPVPNQSAANGTQAIGDEAKRVENRRYDFVEQAIPAYHQSERNADRCAEEKPVGEAQHARQEMLLQRAAGKRSGKELNEFRQNLKRCRQKLFRHETREREPTPDSEKQENPDRTQE